MDVVVWLRSLGLGKYEAVFRENDIDQTVLPSLTHEHLKELGVASLGPCEAAGCHRGPARRRERQDAIRSDDAVKQAREIGQAATSMYALVITPFTYLHCGDYATANAQLADAIQMADERAPCSGRHRQ